MQVHFLSRTMLLTFPLRIDPWFTHNIDCNITFPNDFAQQTIHGLCGL